MKTQAINKSLSLKLFSEAEEIKDLVGIINYGKSLANNEAKDIKVKTVVFHANHSKNEHRYTRFEVKKKSGGIRTIHAPNKGLKGILQGLNEVILNLYDFHEASFGFVPNKSIVENAKLHTGQRFVYNIDLKDFFHSFDRKWVKYGFMMPPFNLNGEKENLAFFLASLCTHPFEVEGEIKHVLPQGAPTSPTITNILCRRLDRKLTGFAKRFGVTYSRYADDITFSSNHDIYKKEDFQKELKRIIEDDQKLKINPKKTRLQNENYRQEVTGLVVNEKVNVTRRYVKQIRQWLYLWERYGYKKASEIILKDHISDKGHVKSHTTPIEAIIGGKLEFLKSVKGENSKTYALLLNRFNKLCDRLGRFQKSKGKGDLSPEAIQEDDILTDFSSSRPSSNRKMPTLYSSIFFPKEKKKVETNPEQTDDFENDLDFLFDPSKLIKVSKNEKRSNDILKISITGPEPNKTKLFNDLVLRKGTEIPYEESIENVEKKIFKSRPIIKLPRPKELHEFLDYFTTKDKSIKNLTHPFASDFIEYDDFISNCKKDFDDGIAKYSNLPDAILERIKQFVFEKKPKWYLRKGSKKIIKEIGWSDSEFVEWYKSNKKHPSYDDDYNKEMIFPFKESIQIRADIGNLRRILKDAEIEAFGEGSAFEIIISENIDSANFFTDVDQLGQAIFLIFLIIKHYGEKSFNNIVKIEFEISEGFKVLQIIHVGSKCAKSAKDRSIMGGDFKSIRSSLFGICNWEIKANFSNGAYQFPLLSDQKPRGEIHPEIALGNGHFKVLNHEDVEGFTHILKFY